LRVTGAINISLLTERMLNDSVRAIANTGGSTYLAKFHLFVSVRVCDKSLRHETTTIVVIAADFDSRFFLLLVCNPYWRATNYTTGLEAKIDRVHPLRTR
jgi:hypothetical protein